MSSVSAEAAVICWARVERTRGRNDVRGTGKVVEGECRGGGGTGTVVEEECRGAGVDCGLPSWLMCFVLVMCFVLMMTNVYKVGPASWERVAREGRTREGSSRGIGGIMGAKGGWGGFEWGTRWVRVGWDVPGVVLSGFAPDGAFRMVVRPEGRVFVFRLMGVPNEADGRVMKIAKASVKVE